MAGCHQRVDQGSREEDRAERASLFTMLQKSLVPSPSKQRAVCANPLGNICGFTKNGRKRIATQDERKVGLSCLPRPPPRLGPLSPGVTVILLLLPEPTGPILDTGVLCPVTCHCPREPQQRPCGVGERISPPLGSQEGCLSFSIF